LKRLTPREGEARGRRLACWAAHALVPREGLDDAGARAVAGDLDKLACAPPIGEIAGTSVGTNPRRTELFSHSVRLVCLSLGGFRSKPARSRDKPVVQTGLSFFRAYADVRESKLIHLLLLKLRELSFEGARASSCRRAGRQIAQDSSGLLFVYPCHLCAAAYFIAVR
jgi:hypothetical protein